MIKLNINKNANVFIKISANGAITITVDPP